MKKLLLLLIIIMSLSLKVYSQIKDKGYGLILCYKGVPKLEMDTNNNIIRIHGDSLTVIKELIKYVERLKDQEEQKYICIENSVKWYNTVPDLWKKGKAYDNYIKQLKQQGYKQIKQK